MQAPQFESNSSLASSPKKIGDSPRGDSPNPQNLGIPPSFLGGIREREREREKEIGRAHV